VQESPKSESQLQRYDERNFGDLFVISGKWLGLYFELILKIGGAFWKYVDCRLILNKYRGFFVKWQEFLGFGIIFQWEKGGGLGPWVGGPRRGGWSTVPPWTPQWPMVGARRSSAERPLWAAAACHEGGKAERMTQHNRGTTHRSLDGGEEVAQ
jgi:hypothetical protein